MNILGIVEIEVKVNWIRRKKKLVIKEFETNGVIHAVKLHRELFGSSLREAKDFVDILRMEHSNTQNK